ncbi:hypothetical protein PFLUV_G00119890 [Scomber scombrus]|uniref:Uncharacterized protein n=1 Tax=Scomber scombrus TaxID=13677 RepID=A0AAV1QFT7_SCOSC
MESFLQIAPHSLAIVLSSVGAGDAVGAGVSESDELPRHHTGYEIFADFKAENTQQHAWNQRITEAVSETFFLGWIDEHVLLIQGKEDHLEVLREGWMRRSLNPPRGFTIKYLGKASLLHRFQTAVIPMLVGVFPLPFVIFIFIIICFSVANNLSFQNISCFTSFRLTATIFEYML